MNGANRGRMGLSDIPKRRIHDDLRDDVCEEDGRVCDVEAEWLSPSRYV